MACKWPGLGCGPGWILGTVEIGVEMKVEICLCRSKQEDGERRKAEEKARRDAIFEKYIKRKMAVEGNPENEASAATTASLPVRSTPPLSHVVMRRKPTSSRSRPVSQPPSIHGGPVTTGAAALASHGSDENLSDDYQASTISHSNYHFYRLFGCILFAI